MSGVGDDVQLPQDNETLFGEDGGQAVVACAPERASDLVAGSHNLRPPLRAVGVVGGDSVLGVPLDRLREAWQT